jgi:hypothetical protein
MKNTDAHQWVQSVANIGVVVSIVFLSTQVSQNRESLDEANRLAALTLSSTALTNYNNLRTLIANDEQVAQIWLKGRAGEELAPAERERFNQLCDFLIWSDAWTFRQMPGFGRPESALEVVARERRLVKEPGFKAHWEATKQSIIDYGFGSFVYAVDAVEDAKARPTPNPVPPPSKATPIKADDEKQR